MKRRTEGAGTQVAAGGRIGQGGGWLLLQKMLESSHGILPLRVQRGRNLYQLPEKTHAEGRRWI